MLSVSLLTLMMAMIMIMVMMMATKAKFVKIKVNMTKRMTVTMTMTVTVETRGMIKKTTTAKKRLLRMRNEMRRMRRWARRRSKHIKNTRHPHQNQTSESTSTPTDEFGRPLSAYEIMRFETNQTESSIKPTSQNLDSKRTRK